MPTSRVHWTLDDTVIEYIEQNAAERGRGELVSKIIKTYAVLQSRIPQTDLDCGVLERTEQRLVVIEQRLSLIQARLEGGS